MSTNYPHPPPHSASASQQRQSKRPNNNDDAVNNNIDSNGSASFDNNSRDIEVPSLAGISIGASASSDTSNTFDWFNAVTDSSFFENTATTDNNNAEADNNNSAPDDNINSSNNDNNNDNNNDIQSAIRAAEAVGATLRICDLNGGNDAYYITEGSPTGSPTVIIGAIYGRRETDMDGETKDMLQTYFSAKSLQAVRPSF
jgi:hypothetical protein